ncbi:MAG: class IV adenylate cyclase [Proteobacteria bacterium]|nr:class IV adenylate cyclase [Pseudomonadota bacterium]
MEDRALEIEVKFYTPDLPAVRKAVRALGAESRGKVFEKNTLYDTAQHRLAKYRRLLRIREAGEIILTYKAPPARADRGFKIFHEHEVRVSDRPAMELILKGLGFFPVRVYEKHRETFVLGDLHILLDETPFGDFLELEGPKEDIRNVAESLRLAWEERLTENYLEIFGAVRQAMGISFENPTFENFVGIAPETGAGLSLLRKNKGKSGP